MPIVLKSGSLKLLELSGPVQTCNGIASFFVIIKIVIVIVGEVYSVADRGAM